MKNADFKTDYLNQTLHLSGQSPISYSSIFHYLPYKVPKPLKSSNIDINEFSQSTTLHQKYPNISLINNLERTAPTAAGVDRLITTSAYNIFFQLMKIDKARSIESDKYTEYDIWLNEN